MTETTEPTEPQPAPLPDPNEPQPEEGEGEKYDGGDIPPNGDTNGDE